MPSAAISMPYSLRGRLLLGTLAWILASVLVAGWVLVDLFRQHVERQLASELAVHMSQLVAALPLDDQEKPVFRFEPTDPRFLKPLSGLYWQVDRLAPGGVVDVAVFHSRSLWDEVLQLPEGQVASVEGRLDPIVGPDGIALLARVRVVTPPGGVAAYRLVVAADRSLLDQPMARFRLMLAISLGLLALGMTLAAIMQVVVGLKPLSALRNALAGVREGHQSRIEGVFPQEIQPLVDEFNQVLQNNQQIVQRARTHAGNLAHALKTPLSVLANAVRQDDSLLGRQVSEQVAVAQRHVDYHLARARAAAAVRAPGVSTPALPVIQGLTRVLLKVYAGKGVQIDLNVSPENLSFRVESQDVQEMLGNLMDNACKWADRQVSVTVQPAITGEAEAGSVCVRVEDDGPGLPEAQRQMIFDRGVRLDERMPGSGLGLDIVRDLVQTYGGKVQAGPSAAGGLAITLVLPGNADATALNDKKACLNS